MSILDIRKGKVWRKREVIPHLVDSIPQDWKINANKQRFVSGLCLTHTHTYTHSISYLSYQSNMVPVQITDVQHA